ncbi:OmpA family protein [Sphingomonas sp. 2R-10]|uniref:OmpA family protein n=1 Tax=Sphingomonas sp. 2R-10 TaxID=3045148 RepID=UPI0013DE0AA0|nr:OmpA family protein [Sphingomonas sp. 2R-10]MDJ0276625.1 OmpA family protein [Sphingomonas sp. 2R-10]
MAALIATPAIAGQAPAARTPTVEGYLCTFAGKCDGSTTDRITRDAPDTRGFRLARPGEGSDAAPATQAPVARTQRRATRSAAVAERAGRTSRSVGTRGYAAAAPTANPGSAGPQTGRRADLMIGFELNSDRLTPAGEASARVFAQSLLMPELRGSRFLIEGHTDERGGRGINVPLSVRRAQRVADYLIAQGVEPRRLQTRGFGSAQPLPGRSASSPANRRVEAELIS